MVCLINAVEIALREVEPKCEKITKTPNGTLIKPKQLPFPIFIVLHDKLVKVGAKYEAGTNTFIIPPDAENAPIEKFERLKLADLVPGPNPRLTMDTLSLEDLYQDIKENGLRQRIEVRLSVRLPGKYEIIDGNRRKKVAEMLGWGDIPVVVRDLNDLQAHEVAFAINNNRSELSSYEKGRWIAIMMQKFPAEYPNQIEAGRRLGISFQHVSRLLADFGIKKAAKNNISPAGEMEKSEGDKPESESTSPEPKEESLEEKIARLPERVTREIRRAPVDKQMDFLKRAVEENWDGPAAKEIVDIELAQRASGESTPDTSEEKKKEVEENYKKEETKKRSLIKNLDEFYPENILTPVIDFFGRQPQEKICKLCYMYAERLAKRATPETVKEILLDIRRQVT
jgi:ParB/RepB/Spo0J family partition protein